MSGRRPEGLPSKVECILAVDDNGNMGIQFNALLLPGFFICETDPFRCCLRIQLVRGKFHVHTAVGKGRQNPFFLVRIFDIGPNILPQQAVRSAVTRLIDPAAQKDFPFRRLRAAEIEV